ncbi:30S ribosomal protein S16 [Limisalsivibrio acetivorans]|uniref:30S ribosomal protein S16 n=1 Tax=Limisalsivibrio acetivorans TaxID=1304888 RepID=UPI0003B6E3FC
MATKIRLMRLGRKKRPFYRIVVADSRERRDGNFIEILGYYNPITDPAEVKVDEERALKWLKEGAIPTDTARNILSKQGIIKKLHEAGA